MTPAPVEVVAVQGRNPVRCAWCWKRDKVLKILKPGDPGVPFSDGICRLHLHEMRGELAALRAARA